VLKGQYNPHEVESEVMRFWESKRIYEIIKKLDSRRTKYFRFIDGPPYPSSGLPHVGTSWNKVLKDSILRYRRLRGYRVKDQPGYDCHGLPIEVAVEKSIGTRSKKDIEEKVGVDKFIELCKTIVLENIKSMTHWFKSLGVFMDWDNPYLTLRDEYIEAGWWLIKKADEEGLLINEKRVVYWCPRCSTTLAEYEVEYKELTDPSIYVKFRVIGSENEYLLIWTTTPWTLPANTFVMAHPDAIYVKVKVGNEVLILAKDRLEAVMSDAGISEYEVLSEFRGRELEGVKYEHPLRNVVPVQETLSKYHEVVLAPEFVTMTEGTGLVHAAPGHGFEDFTVAQRIGVDDIVSPIDDEGRFTKEAGKYAGKYVKDANPEIIEDLRQIGALLHEGVIKHRYPICWRCKSPVVLRTKEQWVLKITRMKEKLIEEVRKAHWVPEWALNRIMNMLENLQDWVLSRQRYWGTPLPIWVCPDGHRLVIGSVDELLKHGGVKPKELHRPWIDEVVLKCPVCGKEMKRVPDVIDVWFDSGIAFYAGEAHPSKIKNPEDVVADFITEGHDQTRGWFFSLLRAGVLGFERVPYRTVLVHGFALDESGREMHKSLGNYIGTDEVLAKVGSDVFRFGVLQNTVWEDLRFSWKLLEEAKRDLSVAWNVFVFASTYMNLDGYDPTKHRIDQYLNHLRIEDRWLLSRLNTIIHEVTKAMEEYRVHDAVRALKHFIVEDVSHWYVRLVRPRVWVEENTPDKMAAYATLYHALKSWLIMAAPIIPFFTEKVYQEFIRPATPNAPPSVHMLEWPASRKEFINKELEQEMNVIREIAEVAAAARMKAKLKLRQPVKRVIIYTSNNDIVNIARKHEELLRNLLNTREVLIKEPSEVREVIQYKIEPKYSILGPRYRKLTKQIVDYVLKNQAEVAKDIITKGKHETIIGNTTITLTPEELNIIPVQAAGYAVQEASWGSLAIDTQLTEEEIADGLARDIIRRIQTMRKELNLPMNAYIKVIMTPPEHHVRYIKERANYIANEVRAKEITFTKQHLTGIPGKRTLTKTWEINGETYTITITET